MAYVNKAYHYHSHASVPVVIQQQQALQQQAIALRQKQQQQQQHQLQPENAVRYVSGVPLGRGQMYYAPHSAAATASRNSTMGARSNSTHSQSTRPSQSLGGSKASIVSRRSGKSSIHQEYHDKKVRRLLLAPYFGKGRKPYLIAVGMVIVGVLFIIGGGVILGLRFHNNLMLTIDKGEILGPILLVIGLVFWAGAVKFYFDAYAISNRERQKLQFSPTRDNMVQVSAINVSHRKQQGEAIVSGTVSNEAVTRTPHGSTTPVRPTNVRQQSSATAGTDQPSTRSASVARSSAAGTPLSSGIGNARQPIEARVYYREPQSANWSQQAVDMVDKPTLQYTAIQPMAAVNPSSKPAQPPSSRSLAPTSRPSEFSSSRSAAATQPRPTEPSPSRSAPAPQPRPTEPSPSRSTPAPQPRPTEPSPSRSAPAPQPRPTEPSPSRSAPAPQPRPTEPSPSRSSPAPQPRPNEPSPSRSAPAPQPRPTEPSPSRSAPAPQPRPTEPSPSRSAPAPQPRPTEPSPSRSVRTSQPMPAPRSQPTTTDAFKSRTASNQLYGTVETYNPRYTAAAAATPPRPDSAAYSSMPAPVPISRPPPKSSSIANSRAPAPSMPRASEPKSVDATTAAPARPARTTTAV